VGHARAGQRLLTKRRSAITIVSSPHSANIHLRRKVDRNWPRSPSFSHQYTTNCGSFGGVLLLANSVAISLASRPVFRDSGSTRRWMPLSRVSPGSELNPINERNEPRKRKKVIRKYHSEGKVAAIVVSGYRHRSALLRHTVRDVSSDRSTVFNSNKSSRDTHPGSGIPSLRRRETDKVGRYADESMSGRTV
jgi:hypothetical protein